MYTTSVTPNISRSQIYCSRSIIVYGTKWCAASQMVRRHLDRLGIFHIYHDIETNPAAGRQVQRWTGGKLSHPTIQIGGDILVEPTLDELDEAIRDVALTTTTGLH